MVLKAQLRTKQEKEEDGQHHTLPLSLGLDFHMRYHQATFSKKKVIIVRVLMTVCRLT